MIIEVNIYSTSTSAAPINLKTLCLEDIFQIRLVSGKREIRSMAYVEVFKKSHHSKRNIQSSFYFSLSLTLKQYLMLYLQQLRNRCWVSKSSFFFLTRVVVVLLQVTKLTFCCGEDDVVDSSSCVFCVYRAETKKEKA